MSPKLEAVLASNETAQRKRRERQARKKKKDEIKPVVNFGKKNDDPTEIAAPREELFPVNTEVETKKTLGLSGLKVDGASLL